MPLAVLRSNVQLGSLPKNFLKDFSKCMLDILESRPALTMVDVQLDAMMMRAGSTSPMATLEIHHNDDQITEDSKREYATKFAQFLVDKLNLTMERVLVLFFDTRCSTMQSTQM